MNSYERRGVRVLVTVIFAGVILASWQAFAARPFMKEVAVYHEKDGGYFIQRIPALLTTAKGTLLAFCEARIGLLYTRGPGKPTAEHKAYPPHATEIVFAHFNLEWLTHGADHLRKKPKH